MTDDQYKKLMELFKKKKPVKKDIGLIHIKHILPAVLNSIKPAD